MTMHLRDTWVTPLTLRNDTVCRLTLQKMLRSLRLRFIAASINASTAIRRSAIVPITVLPRRLASNVTATTSKTVSTATQPTSPANANDSKNSNDVDDSTPVRRRDWLRWILFGLMG